MLTEAYSKKHKSPSFILNAEAGHPEGCGCRLGRSRFLTLVEEFAKQGDDGLDWRVPVRLVQPFHWTCGAESYQRQIFARTAGATSNVLHSALLAASVHPSAAPAGAEELHKGRTGNDGGIDTILINGSIFTGDPDVPWCEALAISDGLVQAIGTSAAIAGLASAEATIIDAGGRRVIPGFNDAHMHHTPDPYGIRLPVDPMANPALEDIRPLIEEAVASAPAGTWIYATMGERLINDKRLDRLVLDQIAPGHPIIFLGMTNHTNVVNSAAMQRLGIRDDEPDPLGGHFERVAGSRRLSGRINEYAQWSPQRCFASMATVDEGVASLRALADDCVRWGITSVQNMSWTPPERYLEMAKSADLPIKLRLIRFPPTGPEGRVLSEGRGLPRHLGARLEFHGTKWILDGTPVEGAAAIGRPYAPDSQNQGSENFLPSEIPRMLQESLGADEQLLLHAIGARTLDSVLDALETSNLEVDWALRNLRIEHGDGLTGTQIPRVKASGAMVVQNPTHFWFYDDGSVFSIFDGAFQSLLDAGITVGIGSDGPLNPFINLLAAIQHPARAHEAMSLGDAVRAYTHGSAVAEGKGQTKGRLAPGFAADIAVLSQDIFSIDPQQLPATRSVLTLVDGAVVFRDACI
ncbi:amidohydrolase [Achromobacter sp.]|uniref:amidohydrolase n=1 Tax=Achromobacter sp. TaxID=134375 RepID=UPI003C71A415